MGLLPCVNHLVELKCVGVCEGLVAHVALVGTLVGVDSGRDYIRIDLKLPQQFTHLWCLLRVDKSAKAAGQ